MTTGRKKTPEQLAGEERWFVHISGATFGAPFSTRRDAENAAQMIKSLTGERVWIQGDGDRIEVTRSWEKET